MKIYDLFKPISNLWTYYGYYQKAQRIRSDWETMKAEWDRIGGFGANTQELLDFLDRFSLLMVEYATWTPTELDDQFAAIVRSVLSENRNLVASLIEYVRRGTEPTSADLQYMATQVSAQSREVGSPMTALYILTIIYQALQYLKTRQDVPPSPDVTPTVEPPKRPVLHFIRTIFNRT